MDWLAPLKDTFDFVPRLLQSVPVIRAVLGLILVFFLPGFAWTLVFFRQINPLERVTLSLGLSIAIVTLSILSLNILVGIRITGVNSVLIIILLTIIPLAIYYLRRLMRTRSNNE